MSGQIVTAQIKKVTPHPDAKKLKLCTVFDGKDDVQIVCGASNAREGMLTVLAQLDSTLPSGLKIAKATLRGVESFGMLCSAKELGLVDEGGIVDLPPGTKLGEPYKSFNPDIFSSVPWYSYEEKEAFWQSKKSRDILITRNGEIPKEADNFQILSKTYWNNGEYIHRNFN